jgi:3-dehydroquinate dehydratase-2
MSDALRIRVLHGPNLNLLGIREPERYGSATLPEIDASLGEIAAELGVEIVCSQHNGEGELVDAIQAAARDGFAGFLINPAAYTHTSVALRDALLAVGLPMVEVHLTNTSAREEFRQTSLVADLAAARVMGFGADSYLYGLRGLIRILRKV